MAEAGLFAPWSWVRSMGEDFTIFFEEEGLVLLSAA
jgi:hypothetical protein